MLRRLWLSMDRQDHVLNWADRRDKRNPKLTAVGTANNVIGYNFGRHLNDDPDMIPEEVDALAAAAGDFDGRNRPFHRYSRLWTQQEYDQAVRDDPGPDTPQQRGEGVYARFSERLEETGLVLDPEALERGL